MRVEQSTLSAKWRSWAEEAEKGGASGLHRWTRLAPTTSNQSANSAHPWERLGRQGKTWSKAWATKEEPAAVDSQLLEPAPGLEKKRLQEAAKSFRRDTALSYDGFHPRGFAELCDAGQQVVCRLFLLVERLGFWPRQIRYLLTVLLPKAGIEDMRPIGLFHFMVAPLVSNAPTKVCRMGSAKCFPRACLGTRAEHDLSNLGSSPPL